jgi:hypothetical protein
MGLYSFTGATEREWKRVQPSRLVGVAVRVFTSIAAEL